MVLDFTVNPVATSYADNLRQDRAFQGRRLDAFFAWIAKYDSADQPGGAGGGGVPKPSRTGQRAGAGHAGPAP